MYTTLVTYIRSHVRATLESPLLYRNAERRAFPGACFFNVNSASVYPPANTGQTCPVPVVPSSRVCVHIYIYTHTSTLTNFEDSLYSQSRCFFLGPIISSVVALQTDLARPWPAMLCLAANSLSLIVCPAILSRRVTEEEYHGKQRFTAEFRDLPSASVAPVSSLLPRGAGRTSVVDT